MSWIICRRSGVIVSPLDGRWSSKESPRTRPRHAHRDAAVRLPARDGGGCTWGKTPGMQTGIGLLGYRRAQHFRGFRGANPLPIRKFARTFAPRTTAVYVTHDQIEAMTMADRIVVLQLGVVEQVGAPLELYDRPVNLFVAGFIGSPAMNFIDATLRRADGSAVAVAADGTQLPAPPDVAGRDGQPIVYGIRPEHLEFVPAGQGLSVDVVVVEPTGSETLVVSRLAGNEIEAVFRERHRLNPGDRISLAPQLGAVHVFDKATGQRIVA